jgi:hypothetical protein
MLMVLTKHCFFLLVDLRLGEILIMGLSGRKVKQRIPQDPRNLSWADGIFKYLSTFNSLTPMFFKMQQGLDQITSQNLDGTRRKVSV